MDLFDIYTYQCTFFFFSLNVHHSGNVKLALNMAISPWSFTASCAASFLKHSFCLWVPHCEYLSVGVFSLLWYLSTCIPHWVPNHRSNIPTHPLKEHEELMLSYERRSKIYIPFRLFLFSIMETNQQGQKTKHMEFDLGVNEYHLSLVL